MELDNIKDELFIYLNDAISEYIGKYDLMLGDISNELDKKYSEGYNILAESVFEQLKESEVKWWKIDWNVMSVKKMVRLAMIIYPCYMVKIGITRFIVMVAYQNGGMKK